ncbi:alpha/beta hydrolase fold protein [Astrocystis sublimbata]|nr:alpha/beta hydrolase fold protein [Astrocystis sublimbata]
MQEHKIETEFGTLWTACSEPQPSSKSNPAILCLHGSASSSRIFEPLLNSPEIKTNHKLVVLDFPGHGRSPDATDPNKSYYQYAYAEAALEVLQYYNITQVVLLGWSLAQADVSALFNPEASDEDLGKVASAFTKSAPPAWMTEDALRANRLAGRTMATKLYTTFKGVIAVVNGESEPLLDLDYCDAVCKGAPRLWRGECVRLKDEGHAPFYDNPQGYSTVFLDFVNDCKL